MPAFQTCPMIRCSSSSMHSKAISVESMDVPSPARLLENFRNVKHQSLVSASSLGQARPPASYLVVGPSLARKIRLNRVHSLSGTCWWEWSCHQAALAKTSQLFVSPPFSVVLCNLPRSFSPRRTPFPTFFRRAYSLQAPNVCLTQ